MWKVCWRNCVARKEVSGNIVKKYWFRKTKSEKMLRKICGEKMCVKCMCKGNGVVKVR